MRAVIHSYGRALLSQMHGKMLLLSVLPFLLSVALWGVLLWLGLQPLIDGVGAWFRAHDGFSISGGVLASFGLSTLKIVIVPLIAMLLLLPLMVLTALIFIGMVAMPVIARHVGSRHFSLLEKKHGGSWFGSLLAASVASLIFILLWSLTLPLYVLPPLALLVQMVLWGALTCRVVAYDALADYASVEERRQIMQEHRKPLLAIGIVSGLAGVVPGALWLGGAVLSVVFFPLLAAISIWLYVLIFIFTGLWFQYYCLEALRQLRAVPISITNSQDQPTKGQP
ncbi:MAG: hypothetical protein ACI83P_002631 [Janthinobacterium sp.]|jgi:hypothetical protein